MNKKKLLNLPIAELYLLIAVLIYWISTALLFNPVALFLLALLLSSLWLNKAPYGFIVGGLFTLLNLYLFLALASEFREFPEISAQATQLLFLGILYLSLNLIASIMMVYRNLENSIHSTELAN